ncbi:DUF3467 domain-containing protein [Planctomycetaceae bacterium]|nr:DUF3467 domain-containing protein [Planctomycetaceae bacterium]
MSDEKNPDEQPVQQIQHSSATARIPDEIGRGVFATAVIVLHGPNEYTIDFLQSLARPNRVAARIILPPVVANQFVLALEQALEKYRNAFGHLPHEPQPSQSGQKTCANSNDARDDHKDQDANGTENPKTAGTPQSPAPPPGKMSATQQTPIADIYDNLKLPDDMLGGVYANMASISHTGSEFCFDFIAQFFPRSAVTARVYMAAPRVPELLSSLKRSINAN